MRGWLTEAELAALGEWLEVPELEVLGLEVLGLGVLGLWGRSN